MNQIEQDFEDALVGEEPDTSQPPAPAASLDQATRMVAQVARIRRLRKECLEAHAAAVSRLNERLDQRLAALETQESWYLEALEMYHRMVLANDPDAKTIQTPAGTLKSVATQPSWEIYDEQAFIAWASQHLPEVLIHPTPQVKIDKNGVKKALKNIAEQTLAKADQPQVVLSYDGADVAGLRVSKGGRKFKIDTGDDQ